MFAAVAALGAGLQVATDAILGEAALDAVAVALTVAIPVVVYLVAVALLHGRPLTARRALPIALTSAIILAVAALAGTLGVPAVIVIMALSVAALVAANVAAMRQPA